jgi:uncharacterized protein (DUF885 family)
MRVSFSMVTGVLVLALSQTAIRAQSHDGLRTLAERYWDARMERYPTWATSRGDYRFNDRLVDVSLAAERRWKATLTSFLQAARAMAGDELSSSDRTTHALLTRSIQDDLLRLECDDSLTPLDPLYGPQVRFPLILVSQPFRNEKDFRDYLKRLEAFSQQTRDIITNMRFGMQQGIVSPRVVTAKVISQIETHIVDDPRDSAMFAPAKQLDVLETDDKRRQIESELLKAIDEHVVPSYRKLLVFVRDEYLPACRDTVGISARPGGAEAYRKLIRYHTTVDLSADEVHKIGLSEVERIRGKMSKIREEMDFDGSLDQFIEHMRTDPFYRFRSADELVKAADAILQRAKGQMPKLFGRLPKADCVMKEIEPYRAASAPVAYYNPPPEDGSRPAYYYINTYQPQERLRFTLEALSYHEAVPGHHLQIALHQEQKDLPNFRRYASFTAFIEGWALYTEKLGYEIGGYRTPEDRYGQLTFEMWRACRLVVDTGMHAKGWTRQRAIDFMARNTSLAPIDIENEIDRYITWPGQALAYKIGELRIIALRQEAEKKLGDAFDIRAFHDELLAEGATPIDQLEERMRRWIAEQRGQE